MLKKIDPVVPTICIAAALAVGLGFVVNTLGSRIGMAGGQAADAAYAQSVGQPQWAASATGRVEPKFGEVRIASQVPGKIDEILAATNDKVHTGDLLVRIDDDEHYVKIAAALAEVSVRERERQEEQVTGLALERRKAEDAVASAERELFAAREAFDAALRAQKAGTGPADAVETNRTKVAEVQQKLASARGDLANVNAKPGMPLVQRLESSLAMARSELSAAEIALERTRIRAPGNGTILNMIAKVGETAVPSPDSVLVEFGDLTSLRLRAEVEERDAAKVHVGQRVVVKADAYPDKTFEGTVASISQSLGAPRIASRGPRRPNDVEVVEVMVDLDGNPPLFTGMRVDTFFKNGSAASANTSSTN